MATLDEKYLDGPNVGYCSDSDEEPEPTPGPPKNPPGSGKAGAKGVLEDYRASKEESKWAAIQAEKNVVKEALRFTLTSSQHPNNEQKSDEDDEEDELEAIRRRKLERMRNQSRAQITEIGNKDEFLEIINATGNGSRAIIHIYRNDLEASETLNEALLELAGQSRNCGFYKVQAKVLDMSSNFTRTGLPALQVYEDTELAGNFVRITDTLGEDFDARNIKSLLAENDIVLETRN